MSNLLKTTAILCSALLFFIGIITEKYCFVLNSKTLEAGQESLDSHRPFENLNLFLLNRQGEKQVISVKNSPVFNPGSRANDINSKIRAYEPEKLTTDSEYLHKSDIIPVNLKTCDIIFPFHYFW
jgi:hypothetical protein